MSTSLWFSDNMGCCVDNDEGKMNLNNFSKWLQCYKGWKVNGVWWLSVPTVGFPKCLNKTASIQCIAKILQSHHWIRILFSCEHNCFSDTIRLKSYGWKHCCNSNRCYTDCIWNIVLPSFLLFCLLSVACAAPLFLSTVEVTRGLFYE